MARTVETLGQAARNGMLLTARCRACDHAASFFAADIAQFADPAHPLQKVRFRCKECEGRDYEVTVAEFDRDRKPKGVVWRPTRME